MRIVVPTRTIELMSLRMLSPPTFKLQLESVTTLVGVRLVVVGRFREVKSRIGENLSTSTMFTWRTNIRAKGKLFFTEAKVCGTSPHNTTRESRINFSLLGPNSGPQVCFPYLMGRCGLGKIRILTCRTSIRGIPVHNRVHHVTASQPAATYRIVEAKCRLPHFLAE